MKRYGIFQPLWLAFHSKSLYRDVGQNWRGAGLIYLWLLATICFLVFTVRLVLLVDHSLVALKPYVAQLPTITISQNEVSIDKIEPYFIKHPGSDDVVAIIDTTGRYTSLNDTQASFLLSKDKLFVRRGATIKEYSLSDVNGVFTPERVEHLLWIGYGVAVLIALITLPLYFLLAVIQTLFYAGLAKLLIYTGLTYKTLLRLAAIALTPTFWLAIIVSLLAIHLPYVWVTYIVLAIAYLLFAIKANWENTTSHV